MAIQTTYSKARANLANLCNQVSEDREIVLIRRRNAEDVALISSSELSSILETAHLLRSPKNARRLLTALNRALNRSEFPQRIEDLKKEIGLG
ncbi:MAG: type II toxin-antitoxin system prevent-host-death family antitoxin [Candidatus Marinimicrobia bacterium]|jgi:antitoxin YefM|nr:type II toxin-antitoxin system prevent-host-death family antitoxin [Candidatus Neomarinimicrobiota bacterium]